MDINVPFPAIIVGVILVIVLSRNIYRLLSRSSLNQIPGPWLAKLTSYYIILIDAAGNRTQHIHRLHERYGSVVRVGPNEVSFTSPSVVKEVYTHGTPYMKAPWYAYMSIPPAGIFALRDRKAHADRRRLLSHAFSQSALNDAEQSIAELITKMLNIVARAQAQAGSKSVDMLLLCRRLSLDVVGKLFLGQSFQALDTEEPPRFLEWMDGMFIGLGIKYAFPIIYRLITVLPFKGARGLVEGPVKIRDYGEKAFFRYVEENGRKSKRRDLLTKILVANDDTDTGIDATAGTDTENGSKKVRSQPLTDVETYLEVGNLIFAGTDTTSTTLTYLFWELSKHQTWQDHLREELKARVPNGTVVPEYSSISDLPVLDAIVNESLRLHSAVPASLPRSTPAGGRMLDGYFIPEDTIVSTQAYTTHRDPLAFPNPDLFNPTRWLDPSTNPDPTRSKTLFIPFSKGPRNCLGQNMAIMELKLTTAAVLLHCRLELAPETTEESMMMVDHFLAVPRGGRCLLRVERV